MLRQVGTGEGEGNIGEAEGPPRPLKKTPFRAILVEFARDALFQARRDARLHPNNAGRERRRR
jgi:hypothetical protein